MPYHKLCSLVPRGAVVHSLLDLEWIQSKSREPVQLWLESRNVMKVEAELRRRPKCGARRAILLAD